MAIPERRLSLGQFLGLPEEKPALEFEDGMVTQKVSPKGQHSTLQAELIERLNRFARPRRLARAYPELRVTFAGASRVPDIAVFAWDRIPIDDTGRVANDFREPPDIVIEIASPEQSTNTLVRHCLWYVANGVRIALLVDPADESVLLFHPGQEPRVLRGPERIDLGNLLPGFELTAQDLFASLRLR